MRFFDDQMRFGLFLGPNHIPSQSPSVSFEQDLATIQLMDRLGYDEVWIGEHHSGGVGTIGSPELMIAYAAATTTRIKLGTGVASLPYHNPYMLADRIVQLSQMTKGRVMLGVGPGQLSEDARMIGIDPKLSRPRMEQAFDAILRLLKGETVTMQGDLFNLVEAQLQMRPYSDFDVAVVSVVSPSGPKLAGKYGAGLISVAATNPMGVEQLAEHWRVVESEAAAAGQTVDRGQWRMMGPMHLAETLEQAIEDVRYGIATIEEHRSHVNPTPAIDWSDHEGVVSLFQDSGFGVIGTPDMAIAQIERLIEKSGGFGTYLLMGNDWANHPAQLRSLELFAERVMPRFRGQVETLEASYKQVMDAGTANAELTAAAQAAFTAQYRASKGVPA